LLWEIFKPDNHLTSPIYLTNALVGLFCFPMYMMKWQHIYSFIEKYITLYNTDFFHMVGLPSTSVTSLQAPMIHIYLYIKSVKQNSSQGNGVREAEKWHYGHFVIKGSVNVLNHQGNVMCSYIAQYPGLFAQGTSHYWPLLSKVLLELHVPTVRDKRYRLQTDAFSAS
jgi:hypothetical protein